MHITCYCFFADLFYAKQTEFYAYFLKPKYIQFYINLLRKYEIITLKIAKITLLTLFKFSMKQL